MNKQEAAFEEIICLGSLNAKVEDRYLNRQDIVPMQYITNKEVHGIRSMTRLGELGLSSLASANGKILLSTGNELYLLRGNKFIFEKIEIPNIKDIHEMTVINDQVWIANTGYDQVICFDIHSEKEIERISLKTNNMETNEEVYHCNQCLSDGNGNILAVVHHVNGRQLRITLADRISDKLKNQGNGGVVNVRTREILTNDLKGPHSARRLPDGSFIVCDSGRFRMVHYSKEWKYIRTIDTEGWARGVALGSEYLFVGVSETRKRYLNILPQKNKVPNMILVYDIESLDFVDRILIKNVEQINNIYTVNDTIKFWLSNMLEGR